MIGEIFIPEPGLDHFELLGVGVGVDGEVEEGGEGGERECVSEERGGRSVKRVLDRLDDELRV